MQTKTKGMCGGLTATEIRNRLATVETFESIAKDLGLTRQAVASFCRSRGIKSGLRTRQRNRDAERKAAVNRGMTIADAAKAWGLSKLTAGHEKRRLKIKLAYDTSSHDAAAAACHERRKKLEAMWKTGMKIRTMADLLGSNVNAVGVCIASARDAGYDFPYRHKYKSPKHKSLVVKK